MQKDQKPEATQGDTRPAQKETRDRPVPRTPNEHDTSADSQSAEQSGGSAQNQAAAKDARRPGQDTDKGPVMDQVYDKVSGGSPDTGTNGGR